MQQRSSIFQHDFSYEVGPVVSPAVPEPSTFVPQICANPECRKPAHSSAAGEFGGQPLCSSDCLEPALRAAVIRENAFSTAAALETGPRVRIGQILVEQGVITETQLERALRSQKLTGAGRLGTWLRQQTQLPEEDFAAALSIQWGCPVFRIGSFLPERMTAFLPRQLVEAMCALPLRVSRDPERLTICFEDRVDAELLSACQRMHGMPVEAGLLASNEFWLGSGELLKASFPASCLVEATSLDEMISAMVETMGRTRANDAHLVYVHNYYWLRMWVRGAEESTSMRDVLCTLKDSAENASEGQLAEEMLVGLERRRAHAS